MKKQFKSPKGQINTAMVIFSMLFLAFGFFSCNVFNESPTNAGRLQQQVLVAVADDHSVSTDLFPRLDTAFLRLQCNTICHTGGTLVVYSIGNPTEESGVRCTLFPVPEIDSTLMMEAQIEQKNEAERVRAGNEQSILRFLNDAQRKIFSDTVRDMNTDLNGFLRKVNVLLNEPQYKQHKRFVFLVSDGVQSIRKVDSDAHYNFTDTAFSLCLCGWSRPIPDTMTVSRFESPQGFTEFFQSFSNQ